MLNAETNGTRGTGAEDNGSAASQSTPLPSSTSGSGGEEGSKGGRPGGVKRRLLCLQINLICHQILYFLY